MKPFQEFRVWTGESSGGERSATAVAALVVLGLLAWLLVPVTHHTANRSVVLGGARQIQTSAGPDTTITSAVSSVAGGTATSPGPHTTVTSAVASSSAGAPATRATAGTQGAIGCTSPPAGGQGVTNTQIKIIVMLIDIAGPAANSVFGVAPPADQQAAFDAVIDSINLGGGIACRKVVVQYLHVNPADQNDQQSKCLDAAGAAPFAVIDPGAYSFTSPTCFAQHHIPYFGGFFLTTQQVHQGYPYLFSLANYDHLYRDTVLGFRDRGAFDAAKGFKKLGFVYRDCHPELVSQELDALHQARLQDSQIVTYNLGCPSAFANPSDIQQAILKFKRSGVTHATAVYAYGDLANFTTVAEQQGFRPQYLLADDGIIAISYGNLRLNPSNIANALIVTEGRYAEERTPGMRPTAGTVACDGMRKAHGLRPTYQADPESGNACNELWMIKAAAEHAPAVRTDALAAGLQRAKSVDFSYPSGPNDFNGREVTTGGEFWRVAKYFADCSCWRVVDPTFRPNYR